MAKSQKKSQSIEVPSETVHHESKEEPVSHILQSPEPLFEAGDLVIDRSKEDAAVEDGGKATESQENAPAEQQDQSEAPQDQGPLSTLTDQEWMVVRLLLTQKGKAFDLSEVARTLGEGPARAALAHLVKLGIVDTSKGGYRITAQSALNVPLDATEEADLAKLEAEVDSLVEEIEGKQFFVAENLRIIRDRKLYRTTHKRFGEYVAERFNRTRDWAYKAIQMVEVIEGIQNPKNDDVEALLQTITIREVPHLAKLKKEPEKMQKALLDAEEEAKSKNRRRTPEDIQRSVGKLKPKEEEVPKPQAAEAQRKKRIVTVKGIDFTDGEVADLPGYFRDLAGWLETNAAENAFSIKVSKAKAA